MPSSKFPPRGGSPSQEARLSSGTPPHLTPDPVATGLGAQSLACSLQGPLLCPLQVPAQVPLPPWFHLISMWTWPWGKVPIPRQGCVEPGDTQSNSTGPVSDAALKRRSSLCLLTCNVSSAPGPFLPGVLIKARGLLDLSFYTIPCPSHLDFGLNQPPYIIHKAFCNTRT